MKILLVKTLKICRSYSLLLQEFMKQLIVRLAIIWWNDWSYYVYLCITLTRMKDGIASVTLPGTRAASGSVSVEFHVCGLKRYLVIQARAQEMIAQHGSFRSRNLIKQQYGTIETSWKDFHILFALLSTIHSTLLTFMSPHSSSNFNRWRTFCGVRAWILYDSYRQLTTGEHWSLVMSTISSNWQIRCFHQPGKL